MITADTQLPAQPPLLAKRLHLHTQHQAVVIMRTDCHVCRSEGLASRSQVLVSSGAREMQANLYQIEGDDLLTIDQVALTETAWQILRLQRTRRLKSRMHRHLNPSPVSAGGSTETGSMRKPWGR
jgi:thymidine phosphorylase